MTLTEKHKEILQSLYNDWMEHAYDPRSDIAVDIKIKFDEAFYDLMKGK